MKKIIASAVGLMLVGGVAVTTAQAVESQFGGYWRTRFTYSDNMTGTAATEMIQPKMTAAAGTVPTPVPVSTTPPNSMMTSSSSTSLSSILTGVD